ncbi:hypothetical protein ACFLXX_04825, partial [Chloroflexota bacterium]
MNKYFGSIIRRILLISLVLVLVFSMVTGILPAKPAFAQTVCFQVDGEGLDDGTPIPGWNLVFGGPPAIATVKATSNPEGIHSGSRGIRVNGDYAAGIEFDTIAKGIVTVDYWHHPRSGSSTNSMFSLSGGNYPDYWNYLTVHKNDQNLWWISDGRSSHPSIASYSGQFTHIVVTIDTDTGLFDLNIDEQLVHQGVVANADKIGLSGIRYVSVHSGRGGGGTDSYLDDILITAESSSNISTQNPNNPSVFIKETKIAKGQVATVDILIRNIEQGLSGYDLFVSLPDEELIQIVDVVFPDFGLTDIGILTNSTTRVRVADLNDIITSGTKEASLVTLKLQGMKLGTSEMYVTIHAMDDDSGNAIEPMTTPGLIEVVSTATTSPTPISEAPSTSSPPSPTPDSDEGVPSQNIISSADSYKLMLDRSVEVINTASVRGTTYYVVEYTNLIPFANGIEVLSDDGSM